MTNNQVVLNIFLSHCTPEMETKLQGTETWSTVEPKQDGLGVIYFIRDVTHTRDETAHTVLNIFRADKELIICHQKITSRSPSTLLSSNQGLRL